MRRVAIRAVFGHGLMLEQERPALLCMAGEAGLSHRGLLEQLGAGRTVRIVAIRTDDLARIDRVGRYLVAVRALFLVAGKAHFGLRLLAQHLVGWCMHLVAVVAGHLVVLVLAAVPVGAIGAFVAGQALAGADLVVRHFKGALLEDDVRRGAALDVGVALQVLFAFAVAGLAVRRAGIAPDAVLGLVDGKNRRGSLSSWQRVQIASFFRDSCADLGRLPLHTEIRKLVCCRTGWVSAAGLAFAVAG